MIRLCLTVVFLLVATLASASQSSFWLEGEYLLWKIKENPLPAPLLTRAAFSDPLPGAIGQPGTEVLLGQDSFHTAWMNGFRVMAGAAVGKNFEITGNYFLLPTTSRSKSFGTTGEPGSRNLAVPIFDVTGVFGLGGVPGETLFILPGPLDDEPGFSGKFDCRIGSRLQGAELDALYHLLSPTHFALDLITGFRWFQLHESLHFEGKTHTAVSFSSTPAFYNFSDRFVTTNNFFGAQIGIDGQYRRKKWRLEGMVKGGLGGVQEKVKIKGSSQTSSGNLFFETLGTATRTLPGGVFAEPTQRGEHSKGRFAYNFEGRVGAVYKPLKSLEIDLGYTFFWLSQTLRPGKQIDRKINTTLTALANASRDTVGTGTGPIPFGDSGPAPAPEGPKKPSPRFRASSFYLHGLDVGLIFKF